MKTSVVTLPLLISVVFLTGCFEDEPENSGRSVFAVDPRVPKPDSGGARFGFPGEGQNPAGDPALNQTPGEFGPPYDGTMTLDPGAPGTDPGALPEDPGTLGAEENVEEKVVEKPPAKPDQPNIPYADPIPGQSGYVYSPFAPGRPVEVTGFAPGQVVTCPYTQKKFKVP